MERDFPAECSGAAVLFHLERLWRLLTATSDVGNITDELGSGLGRHITSYISACMGFSIHAWICYSIVLYLGQ